MSARTRPAIAATAPATAPRICLNPKAPLPADSEDIGKQRYCQQDDPDREQDESDGFLILHCAASSGFHGKVTVPDTESSYLTL